MNPKANPGLFYLSCKRLHKRDKRPKKIYFCYARNYIVIAFLMKLSMRRNSQPYDSKESLLARSTSRDCINRARL